jgi:hypothetical protein
MKRGMTAPATCSSALVIRLPLHVNLLSYRPVISLTSDC